jgi:hypothetical protein
MCDAVGDGASRQATAFIRSTLGHATFALGCTQQRTGGLENELRLKRVLKPPGTGRRQRIWPHAVHLYVSPATLAKRLPMIAASEPSAYLMAPTFQLGLDLAPDAEVQIHGAKRA